MAQSDSTTTAIANGISTALPIVQTVVDALFPGAAPAAAIGVKIAQGVLAGVPEAQALYNQFQSGDTPTTAQLDAYATAEDGAYAKLMADLAPTKAKAS